MTYADALKKGLLEQLGKDWVTFMPNWSRQRRCAWQGKGNVPNALLLHHTAGAATTSTNPAHPGNQKGANAGQVNFVQTHYEVPAANFTLDRDGTVYVHSAYPIWHAGVGSFKGKAPWSSLGIPNDMGNDYMLGVEIVSKGLAKDFTDNQKDSLVFLLRSCRDASDWANIGLLRRPQHRDWTTRKVDIKYSNAEVADWILEYGFTNSTPVPTRP